MKINIFIFPFFTYEIGLAKTESCIIRITKQSLSLLYDHQLVIIVDA